MTTELRWRKSSYTDNGQCIEIAEYRISTFSTTGGSCVAVAPQRDSVLVRNSNHVDRGTIAVAPAAMAAFVAACSAGDLDDLT